MTPTLNSAKSSNAVVRLHSIQLFKAIVHKAANPENLKLSLDELLALPKSGKTSGSEHRTTLYTMLGHLTPSRSVSATLVQTAVPLLAKETHDTSVATLASSLAPHLVFCLREDIALPPETLSLICKEMNGTKPVLRRAFCSLAGDAFWSLGSLTTQAALDFATAVYPAFENNLKTVAASPAASPAGPLEAYVAVAVLLGLFHRSGKFGRSITFYRRRRRPRFPDALLAYYLQTPRLIKMLLSNLYLSQVPSHRSCCGIRCTRR